MAVNCWARSLGGCSTVQSAEHWISQDVLGGKSIRIQGFPWCAEEAKEIGIASAAANILCQTHNSDLSPVDAAAGNFFRVLQECQRLQGVRKGMRPRRWRVQEHAADGFLLERWFLKTTINLVCCNPAGTSWPDGSPGRSPPAALVRTAFGVGSLPAPAGLYSGAGVGQQIEDFDQVGFLALVTSSKRIVGGAFDFRGYRFVLALEDLGLERNRPLGHLGEEWETATPMRHPKQFRIEVRKQLSSRVDLDWQPQKGLA